MKFQIFWDCILDHIAQIDRIWVVGLYDMNSYSERTYERKAKVILQIYSQQKQHDSHRPLRSITETGTL